MRRRLATSRRRGGETGFLCAAAWIGAAAALQAGVLWRAPAGFWRPDALLVVSVAFAVRAAPRRALVCAAAAGIVSDLLSCGPFGLNALLNLLAAHATLYARSLLFVHAALAQVALGAILSLGKTLAYCAVVGLACAAPPGWPGLDRMIGGAIACGLLTPVAVWLTGGGLPGLIGRPAAHGQGAM